MTFPFPFSRGGGATPNLPEPERWSSAPWRSWRIPAGGGVGVQVDVFAVGSGHQARLLEFARCQAAGLAIRALLHDAGKTRKNGAPMLVGTWGSVADPAPAQPREGAPASVARLTGFLTFGVDADGKAPRLVAVISSVGRHELALSWDALRQPGFTRTAPTPGLGELAAELERTAVVLVTGRDVRVPLVGVP